MTSSLVLIGVVARECGVSDDTIRHYEKKGLLDPVERTSGGYRRYAADAIPRVRLIRRALTLGFTLDELTRIFRQRSAGMPPCRQVRSLAEQKLRDLDDQIAQLTALRSTLAKTLAHWDERLSTTAADQPAHLLESLT
jgi:DNA-binding transcriptional MerR regulator